MCGCEVWSLKTWSLKTWSLEVWIQVFRLHMEPGAVTGWRLRVSRGITSFLLCKTVLFLHSSESGAVGEQHAEVMTFISLRPVNNYIYY